MSNGSRLERPGYYFEDLEVGDVMLTNGATVTESAIIEFGLKWDPQPFHIDVDVARRGTFQGLIASGLHTLNIVYRLFCDSGMLRGTVVAGLSVGETQFLQPVFAGTTLSVRATVSEKSDKPQNDRGRVRVSLEAMDPSNTVVMMSSLNILVACRPR